MSDGPRPALAALPGRVAVAFAGLMHLLVGGFVLAAHRVLPMPVALALAALWTALATLIWRWRHVRPLAVLALPALGVAAWWLAMATLG